MLQSLARRGPVSLGRGGGDERVGVAGSERRLPLALASDALGRGLLARLLGTLPRHAPGRLVRHHLRRGRAEGRQPLAVVALVHARRLLGIAHGGGAAALGDVAPVRVEVLLRRLAPGLARNVAPGLPIPLRAPFRAAHPPRRHRGSGFQRRWFLHRWHVLTVPDGVIAAQCARLTRERLPLGSPWLLLRRNRIAFQRGLRDQIGSEEMPTRLVWNFVSVYGRCNSS